MNKLESMQEYWDKYGYGGKEIPHKMLCSACDKELNDQERADEQEYCQECRDEFDRHYELQREYNEREKDQETT